MAKKFDTNPLDPNFPETVRDTQKELETVALPEQNGRTRKFAEAVDSEDETRRFDETEFESFQAKFGNAEDQPATYQPQPFYTDTADKQKTHNIGSISLPENILMALPYVPFSFVGIIAAVIELIFIPKSEPKIRYHAAQGLAAQLGILLILSILENAGWMIGGIGTIASIFSVVTTIMLVIFTIKAWQGKPIHIESVEKLTDWLEEIIKPQK